MRKSTYINFLNARSIKGNGAKALSNLDDMEQIICYLAEGHRYDEIASKKQVPVGSIKRKCTEIREHFHCKTNAQLVYKYVKGEIDVFRLL